MKQDKADAYPVSKRKNSQAQKNRQTMLDFIAKMENIVAELNSAMGLRVYNIDVIYGKLPDNKTAVRCCPTIR